MSLIAFLTAFMLSFILTPVARWVAKRARLLDVPNERSSHSVPTPRAGGYAILAGIATVIAMTRAFDPGMASVITGAAVIALVGAIDDVVDLREWQKLLVQVVTASVVVITGGIAIRIIMPPAVGALPLTPIGLAVTIFWIVGFTNAFNFMDGINGIASVQAIVAGGVVALLFMRLGDVAGVVVSLAIVGAAAGFLPWNLPSGSIFMGDVGSATLGFVLASLVVRYGSMGGNAVAAALPLLPFVADTSVTLIRRILRKERFFSAHRTHYYQRLNQLGWSHSAVTALWFCLMMGAGAGAIVLERSSRPIQLVIVLAVLMAHVVLFAAIERRQQHSELTS